MADEIVWFRCKKCMAVTRLLAYIDMWRRYTNARTLASFIDEHIEHCYANVQTAHVDNETFFDLVSFSDLAKVIDSADEDAKEIPPGEETTSQMHYEELLAELRKNRPDAAELLHAKS
ncbi:MAG TPA: hypothetical protein VLJ17_24575 [Xanthobacteraceae bacterium]|nr:hypothetical protein [Xanthobacteraceae bacterium]